MVHPAYLELEKFLTSRFWNNLRKRRWWRTDTIFVNNLSKTSRITWWLKCLACRYSATISSMRTICENISTLCPVSLSRHNSLSSNNSLPLPLSKAWNLSVVSSSSGSRISCVWLQHFFSSIIMFTKLPILPFRPFDNALWFFVNIHLKF